MDSRTVLVNPGAVPPRPPTTQKLCDPDGARWVTRIPGEEPLWTMVNPGLSRRHRRVAAVAFAPLCTRVLTRQILAPIAAALLVAGAAGGGLATIFANKYVPGAFVVGSLLVIAMVFSALSLVTRMRQGVAQAAHVAQVRGDHAVALEHIESRAEAYNRSCRLPGQRLPTVELLWNAVHDPASAIAIARTLEIVAPSEDVRVLDYLHALTDDARFGPGQVTTLEQFVRRDPQS